MKWEVGQEVFVTSAHHKNRWQTITKIGRRWVYIGNHSRFDMETRWLDSGGFSVSERAWVSEDEYNDHKRVVNLWRGIRRNISNNPRPGITAGQLLEVYEILGLEKPE